MIKQTECIIGEQICGATNDMLITINKRRHCPKCFNKRENKKNCLRCEKKFRPGCENSFVCPSCYRYNMGLSGN